MLIHRYDYMTHEEFVHTFQSNDQADKLTLEVCREALARLEHAIASKEDGYDDGYAKGVIEGAKNGDDS